jgi:FAD/FMN-containing dehydrogenase
VPLTAKAVDAVLADGSAVHVSAQADPDLFWAMRGAADSFGIVTAFHLQTSIRPIVVTHFSYTWTLPAKEASDAFLAYQRYVQKDPPWELGITLELQPAQVKGLVKLVIVG